MVRRYLGLLMALLLLGLALPTAVRAEEDEEKKEEKTEAKKEEKKADGDAKADTGALETKLPDGWIDGFCYFSRGIFKRVQGEMLTDKNVIQIDPVPAPPFCPKGLGKDPEEFLGIVKSTAADKGTEVMSGEFTQIDKKETLPNGWVVIGKIKKFDGTEPGFVMRLNFPSGDVRVMGYKFVNDATRDEGLAIAKALNIPEGAFDLKGYSPPLPEGWKKADFRNFYEGIECDKMFDKKRVAVQIHRLPKNAPKDLETYAKWATKDDQTPDKMDLLGNNPDFVKLMDKKALDNGWYIVGEKKGFGKDDPPETLLIACVEVNGTKLRVTSTHIPEGAMAEVLELLKGLK